jgi:hypothetical protein
MSRTGGAAEESSEPVGIGVFVASLIGRFARDRAVFDVVAGQWGVG